MTDRKRVLLIAYYFPPYGGAGTQRMSKLCKYLPSYGWEPVVVTREAVETGGLENQFDHTLMPEIEQSVATVERVATPMESSGAAARLAWAKSAVDRAIQVAQDRNVDAAVISMSPYELAREAHRVRLTARIPVILDLRDPWALDGSFIYRSKKQWRQDYDLMLKSLDYADAVVVTTAELQSRLRTIVAPASRSSIALIPNGFDAADFPKHEDQDERDDGQFRIVHTGHFQTRLVDLYTGPTGFVRQLKHYRAEPVKLLGRSAIPLFRALAHLKRNDSAAIAHTRIQLVGGADSSTLKWAERLGISEMVEFTGYVNHRESIRRLLQGDVLYVPLYGVKHRRRSLIVPGKVYEYLAANRPILGALPPGDAADIVSTSSCGTVVDPCSHREIALAIESLHSKWASGDNQACTLDDSHRVFERRALARKWSAVLNSLPTEGRFRRKNFSH